MIKVENIRVYNIARAVYSARNPLDSWAKSDSDLEGDVLGENDLTLARKLYRAGSEHRKYLRQIFVTMDITAPLYLWKEADTYKVGTTANSCSTMHTIHKKGISKELFSLDGGVELDEYQRTVVEEYINLLEDLRKECKSGDPTWRTLIQLLPESFNQRRTVTMNYENVVTIIKQRTGHKLREWNEFVEILKGLPYVKEITEG